MNKSVTIVTFTSTFDIRFTLFKEILEEAGIRYMTVNEITSSVDGVFRGSPTSIGIEIRVLEENAEEALQIWNSIQ